VGILYFGFSGAIFFAHITRMMTRAPVKFSSCLCIQYDTNITTTSSGRCDFPVLEFRIVINKANVAGWDILDASLKCTVSIDEPAEEPDTNPTQGTDVRDASELWAFDVEKDAGLTNMVPVSKHAFHKVDIEADSYPYFRRVWYCRHVLNSQSPLLRRDVRRKIRSNGNKWPASEINDFEGIRHSLVQFNAIVATMTGTLNTTSNSVFRKMRYQFEDICVGYKFAGLLYLSKSRRHRLLNNPQAKTGTNNVCDGRVKVDLNLIHDITPQDRGG
jgi:hypothetical protein